MNLLNEIAIRAKYDGSFTQEWAPIRNYISREGALGNVAGNSEIQKLQAWAERHGLLMDFDIEYGGFSSEIRTVTFWNGGEAVATLDACESPADDESPASESGNAVPPCNAAQTAVGSSSKEYFDWDAVGCR